MLRKHYKKFHQNTYIVKFSKLVSAENLWHFNRESVSKGIAVGVACGWVPIPFHTTLAIFLAILIDCNVPLAVAAIWTANPITMPFMYYFAYKLGEYMLGLHSSIITFHLSMHDTLEALHEIWQPFLLGCLILGILSGLVVYIVLHMMWPNIHHKFKNHRHKHHK